NCRLAGTPARPMFDCPKVWTIAVPAFSAGLLVSYHKYPDMTCTSSFGVTTQSTVPEYWLLTLSVPVRLYLALNFAGSSGPVALRFVVIADHESFVNPSVGEPS